MKIILFSILILGAALRFWGIHWGLPYEYQSEEYKIIKYALRMGSGDLNPHFFEYPSLYLYFTLFLFGLYYFFGKLFGLFASTQAFAHHFIQNPTPFYTIGRAAECFFGVGVILITYHIGKKLFSKKTGLLGSFMVAILPEFVNKAHFAKGDMAALFLGLLFWLSAYYLYKTGRLLWYLLAGTLFGLALSTKYYLIFFFVSLPVTHFLSPHRAPHKNFFLSLLTIPIFFFLGSPFLLFERKDVLALLSPNFYSSLYDSHSTSYLLRAFLTVKHSICLTDFSFGFGIDSMGLGILSMVGLFILLREKKRETILLWAPIAAYLLGVSTYHNPSAGYLSPIFPLFLLCGASLLGRGLSPIPRTIIISTLFLISSIFSTGASFIRSYSYTLEDTRTTAKKWIEENIPNESKILMDVLVNSPPLEMSRNQLERFYTISQELNHYKKDYFRLKLETLNPKIPAYQIFLIKRTPGEIGSLQNQVEEVQKVQDLFPVNGSNTDFETLKKTGIEYIITNSWAQLTPNTHLISFYQMIPSHAELIKTVEPRNKFFPGPTICVYKLI